MPELKGKHILPPIILNSINRLTIEARVKKDDDSRGI